MKVFINYIRSDGIRGSFPAENVMVDDADPEIFHFTWTITGNVTVLKGKIRFLVCVRLTDETGKDRHHWNSEINEDLYVSEGLDCSDIVEEMQPDVLMTILSRLDSIEENGGSGGVDVTAEVGQTIIVKEVDASGKPTKWESAEYQPRTHWTETTEILPETTVECAEVDEDEDGVGDGLFMGVLPEDISLTPNADYSVVYNGSNYVCKAVLVSDDESSRIFSLGNIGPLGTGANTGEPFAVMLAYYPSEGYSENVIVTFDGSASVTLSITEVNYTPVPVQYVTNAFPYYIDVSTAEDGTMSIKETSMELYTIHASGRQMVARCETSADALKTYVMYYLDGVGVMNDLFIVEMMFHRIPMTKMVGHGYLSFKFANDGTVTISKSID
jgi:hypothetical protein